MIEIHLCSGSYTSIIAVAIDIAILSVIEKVI